jgi:high-affinity nickel-transport protein
VKRPFSFSALAQVFSTSSSRVRQRVVAMYVLLLAFNLLAWLLAFIAFFSTPRLLFLALTAYTFGLRHAFDADHISAIDNVTRKLMQEKQYPVGVGFFFSLGHSTVVVLLTGAIAVTAIALHHLGPLQT